MSTIYLSGPISLGGSTDDATIAEFTARFAAEAERLRIDGWEVINPCECPKEDSWGAYMRHGIRAVADADIVAVLPRWQESRGATLEAYLATQLGIPVVDVELLGLDR